MKIFIILACLFLSNYYVLAQQQTDNSNFIVVAGYGWKGIYIGAKREIVQTTLGEGKGEDWDKFPAPYYFREYPEKGVFIYYSPEDNTVKSIFLFNNDKSFERFVTIPVKTDKGINWNSTPKQVRKMYGVPKKRDAEGDWQKLTFDGIEFHFVNNRMVRIKISQI